MSNKLFLSKDLYSIVAIKNACEAFSKLASINITDKDRYWVCEFNGCRYDLDRTINEFENYVIGITNKEG